MAFRNTILVHAPVGRDWELIAYFLANRGITASPVIAFADMLNLARTGNAGALLITVEALSSASIADLSRALENQPHWSDLPVLILVPGGGESSKIGFLESILSTIPNLTLLERPIRPSTLASVASNALRGRYRQYQVQRIMEEREQDAQAMIESEKLAAVGRLASTIAHEINNPLEAVTNLLYLLKEETGLTDAGREYLDTADRELARVSQIASQTLRFHRQSTSATRARLDVLLEEVLRLYRSRLNDSRIAISREFDTSLRVACYEGDIRQVLNNLIGNAFDVMRLGGCLRLRTRPHTWWATGQSGVMITVADDGPGMSEQVRRRIFDAFYSTKGIHGTGLGLWISKRIVQKHQGHLTVRSSSGERHGTVFHLWLPYVLAESANEEWHAKLFMGAGESR